MTKEQMDAMAKEVGNQAAKEFKGQIDALETALTQKQADLMKGTVSNEQFEAFKTDNLKQINDALKRLEDITAATKETGEKVTALLEKGNPTEKKDLTVMLKAIAPKIAEMKKAGSGFMTITGEELKAAGIQTVSSSVTPASPYLPGLAGTPLEIFEIVRPEDWITPRVDIGQTDQYKLAWINELPLEGAVGINIAEAGLKSQVQYKYTVEISTAEKSAAYVKLTEEFEQDLPGLAAELRGMLRADVFRALDNTIQQKVFAAARAYNLPAFAADIYQANLWDAAYALFTQPGFKEFSPNTLAMNWITNGKMQMAKNTNGTYLLPPFKEELLAALVRANQIETNVALAGDLKQYKVRMYKDYELKIGWINDDFIRNQFGILGEIRYHGFISENRKDALAKGDLNNIRSIINGTPGS